MRVWLACFIVLFALVELYEWAKHLSLPLPVYILAGAFLAIASNYDKLPSWFSLNVFTEAPSAIDSGYASNGKSLDQSQSHPIPQQISQPISNTINISSEENHSDGRVRDKSISYKSVKADSKSN